MTGLILGIGIAGVLDHAPLLVRLLVIPVAGGAALLPDIDKPGSRVARSLGPVTWLISMGVAALAVAVYHATRTDHDSPADNGGHRRLTHTVPGCALFGAIVGVAVWAHPAAGAMTLALLVGLMALGFKRIGLGFTTVGALGSWLTLTQYPGWWWLWPLTVLVGAWVHCIGDTITSSGTPMLWPLMVQGQRWHKVCAPATFRTGGPIETSVVTPILWAGAMVAVGLVTGVLPVLAAGVSAVIRG